MDFIGGVEVEISVSLGIGRTGSGLEFALILKPGSISLPESSKWYN